MNKRNVIWIASYPKSGNTWIHSVLRLAGKTYGFPQVDMDVYNLLKNGVQPQVCAAVSERFTGNACVVLKTHAVFKREGELHQFPNTELVNTAFVHIYRNPLDVLLSYLNFSRLEYKGHAENGKYQKLLFKDMLGYEQPYEYEAWREMVLESIPQANLDHALDYFSDHGLSIGVLSGFAGSWLENTQSWIDAANDLPGFSIRYEDCLADPEQLVKLCDLFIFNRNDVLSALKFVNSRAQSMSASANQDHAVFYNKMSAYYFTNYFSKDAIERFLSRHEGSLRRFGYDSLFEHA